jgi:hypothetical protein
MLGILYQGTKTEANSWNFVLNHSAEQKTLGIPFRTVPQRRKMLGIPFRRKKIEASSRNSVPKHVSGKNMLSILFYSFHFLPFRASELTLRKPQNASE